MSEWQPIETAPMDGTWVLLTGGLIDYGWDAEDNDQPHAVVGQVTEQMRHSKPTMVWHFAWYDSGYYGEYEQPTHWMPLPDAP